MTKAELIEAVADDVNTQAWARGAPTLTKATVGRIVNKLFGELNMRLRCTGAVVAIPRFGIFRVVHRKARTARNPNTGAEIKVKASRTVRFKPARRFRDDLNMPPSSSEMPTGHNPVLGY